MNAWLLFLASSPASLGECNADESLRLNCGHQSITSSACQKLGCCYDAQSTACYYRLNGTRNISPLRDCSAYKRETIPPFNVLPNYFLELLFFFCLACSLDGHFVFTVKATDTHPPIDPSSLVIKDQPHCLPAISTSDTAVFKMGVMDCGAKMRVTHHASAWYHFIPDVHFQRCRKEEVQTVSPVSHNGQQSYVSANFNVSARLYVEEKMDGAKCWTVLEENLVEALGKKYLPIGLCP